MKFLPLAISVFAISADALLTNPLTGQGVKKVQMYVPSFPPSLSSSQLQHRFGFRILFGMMQRDIVLLTFFSFFFTAPKGPR